MGYETITNASTGGAASAGKNRGLDADDQGVLIDLNTPEDERLICSMLPVN